MGGVLHLVQRGGDWAGPQSVQAPPRYTKLLLLFFSFLIIFMHDILLLLLLLRTL